MGRKNVLTIRIVIADSRRSRDGRFIERVGSYNPMLAKDHEDRVKLDQERIKYWLSVGATPSDRVARFLARGRSWVIMPAIHEQTKEAPCRKPKRKSVLAEAIEEKKKAMAEAAAEAEAAAAAPADRSAS